MITQQEIINFCNQFDYDLRKTGNGRWIDQKCTADVVTIVADCIYNYSIEKQVIEFNSRDIWHFDYTIENVESIFKKPGVETKSAKNEYDKFFQQPMEMLAYANVLIKIKKGKQNFYKINNQEVLEYIAIREKNALIFLKTYIEKVLIDSDIYEKFECFFKKQTKKSYLTVKQSFSNFIIDNTRINGIKECNRIFTKVLNPLAFFKNSYGTELGRISKHVITYDMLMYNRNNFRDIYVNKPKDITRREYRLKYTIDVNEAYYQYQSRKAKKHLRLFNDRIRDGKTEHLEESHVRDKATHMHHIFPESLYPEICYFLENIIALTPTQHLNYAHPNGHTNEIDEQYQHLLILSKVERIRENLIDNSVEKIYEFSNLIFILKIGFDNDDILKIGDMDFSSIVNLINRHYSS